MKKDEFISRVAKTAGIRPTAAAQAVDAVLRMMKARRRAQKSARQALSEPTAAPMDAFPSVREIRDLAVRVWENPADAEEFLTTPHGLLDGETPLAAAHTDEGAARVREILLALEYGLPV